MPESRFKLPKPPWPPRNLEQASRRLVEISLELQSVYNTVKYNMEGWSDARGALADAMSKLGTATASVEDEIRKLRAQRK